MSFGCTPFIFLCWHGCLLGFATKAGEIGGTLAFKSQTKSKRWHSLGMEGVVDERGHHSPQELQNGMHLDQPKAQHVGNSIVEFSYFLFFIFIFFVECSFNVQELGFLDDSEINYDVLLSTILLFSPHN